MVNVRLSGPQPVDATAETVFTNTSGTITTVSSVTLAQPSTGVATVVRLSLGVLAAATTIFEYQVPAGTGFYTFYPGWVLTGTDVIQAQSTVSDDVVIMTINGYREP